MEKSNKAFSIQLGLLFLCSSLLIIVSCSQESISDEKELQKITEVVKIQ